MKQQHILSQSLLGGVYCLIDEYSEIAIDIHFLLQNPGETLEHLIIYWQQSRIKQQQRGLCKLKPFNL